MTEPFVRVRFQTQYYLISIVSLTAQTWPKRFQFLLYLKCYNIFPSLLKLIDAFILARFLLIFFNFFHFVNIFPSCFPPSKVSHEILITGGRGGCRSRIFPAPLTTVSILLPTSPQEEALQGKGEGEEKAWRGGADNYQSLISLFFSFSVSLDMSQWIIPLIMIIFGSRK